MKYAWIENDKVRDVAHGNPAEIYHPDVAVHYDTQVPDDAANGDGWVNGELIKPEPPAPLPPVEPPAPVPPKVSPVEFMLLFTSPERVALKAARSTDPVIDDWMDIIQDPRLTHVDLALQSTQDALSYAVSVNILTAERREQILTGQVQ
jgi:hypothetical protein